MRPADSEAVGGWDLRVVDGDLGVQGFPLTLTNRTRRSIDVPDTLSAVDGSARFQILDTTWKVLPNPTANPTSPKSIRLQPGGRVTLRLVLNGPGGYRLSQPGIYHIVLLGSSLGLPDSNTLTLRVDP